MTMSTSTHVQSLLGEEACITQAHITHHRASRLRLSTELSDLSVQKQKRKLHADGVLIFLECLDICNTRRVSAGGNKGTRNKALPGGVYLAISEGKTPTKDFRVCDRAHDKTRRASVGNVITCGVGVGRRECGASTTQLHYI